jgi:hypothetical protein
MFATESPSTAGFQTPTLAQQQQTQRTFAASSSTAQQQQQTNLNSAPIQLQFQPPSLDFDFGVVSPQIAPSQQSQQPQQQLPPSSALPQFDGFASTTSHWSSNWSTPDDVWSTLR